MTKSRTVQHLDAALDRFDAGEIAQGRARVERALEIQKDIEAQRIDQTHSLAVALIDDAVDQVSALRSRLTMLGLNQETSGVVNALYEVRDKVMKSWTVSSREAEKG